MKHSVEQNGLWDFPQPFTIPIQVEKDDIDSFGHVNNAVYLRWLTECAWAHSAHVGLPEETCVELRRGMAVRSIRLDILASAYLDESLLVGNWITSCSRLKATRQYQIVRSSDEVTLLRGEVDFVCVDLDSGRPVRMPEPFVKGYGITI